MALRHLAAAVLALSMVVGQMTLAADEHPVPAGPPPVVVRVVACDGTPVAGAVVEVSEPASADCSGRYSWRRTPIEEWAASTRRPTVASTAKAGDDGTAPVQGLRAGRWTFVATKPSWALGWTDVSIGDDAGTRTATIVLVRGHALTGHVRDADGKPIAGATVFATLGCASGGDGDPSVIQTTTGADGSYRLDDLPMDDVQLWLAPPGGLALPRETIDLRTVTAFDVDLPRVRAPVTGTVLDAATGEPIAGALVRAATGEFDPPSAAAAVTDERGRYAIDGLRAWRVDRLLVEKSGYVTFDAYGADASTAEVRLPRAARLVGVVRGPDGPVAGAHVHAGWCGPYDYHVRSQRVERRECSVVTDSAGRYVIDRLAPGVVVVEVGANGLVSPWPEIAGALPPEKPDPGPNVVTTSLAAETTLDAKLVGGRVVHGPVVDAAKRPVEAVRVEGFLSGSGIRQPIPGAVAFTDGDGRFTLPHLPLAGDVVIRADRDGWKSGSDWFHRGELGLGLFRLSPAPRVEGRVRAADGSALRDLRVELLSSWDELNERDFQHPKLLRAAADGRFGGFVPWRSFRVRASAEGLAPAISSEFWTDGPGVIPMIDLTLGVGFVFSGRVTDSASGKPIARAIVSASEWHVGDRGGDHHEHPPRPPFMPFRDSGVRVVAVTDADGRFRVPGLFRRPYDFVVAAAGHADSGIAWDASDPNVASRDAEIRLDSTETARARAAAAHPSASITGSVVDAEGRPVNGVEVRALPDSPDRRGPREAARTDDHGAFSIDALDVGATYRLVVRREAVLPAEVRDVVAGTRGVRIAVVRVAAGPASSISGTIRFADGAPVPWFRLRFTHVGEMEDVEWADIASNGFFRRQLLLPGAYRVDLQTYGPDTLPVLADLGVVETGTKDVVLTVPR